MSETLTDEIAVLKVEAVQLVAGLLRIHDILVDNESGAFRVIGNSLANLSIVKVSGAPRSVGRVPHC